MNRYIFILLCLCLFIPARILFAEQQVFQFNNLTSSNGLSNNNVNSICKDYKGFLWFGTDDGLNMYDGYHFKVFYNESSDTNSLVSNTIFKIYEDSQKQMWIATNEGINLFNRQKLTFKHIPILTRDGTILNEAYIRDIFEDAEGNIYIASATDILIFDQEKNVFYQFLDNIPEFNAFTREGLRSFVIDSKNRIWIGSVAFGLFAYDLNNNSLIASPVESGLLQIKDHIQTIKEHNSGDIWIGTNNGFYIIKENYSVSHVSHLKSSGTNMIPDLVLSIFFDKNGSTWLATDGSGLYIYKGEELVEQIIPQGINNNEINLKTVRAFCEDNQKILWLGTYQGGVCYTELNPMKKFEHLRKDPFNANSLCYNAVSAIYEDSNGNLWIGTDGGGLDFCEAKTRKFKHVNLHHESQYLITGDRVLTIIEDRHGNIWIGGYLLGLKRIEPKSGKVTSFLHNPDNPNSLSNNDVRDIFIDNDDKLWIATNGGGINVMNVNKGTFEHLRFGGDNSIVSNWCLQIFKDSYGMFWFGTYGGLSMFNPNTGKYKNYLHSTDSGSISSNWVYSIAEDTSGNMWIGTTKGLNYFNRHQEKFKVIRKRNGLPNEVINGILLDNENNLWLSTNKGICHYHPLDNYITTYDVSDGLIYDQFNRGASHKSKTGQFYFGGIDGLITFYPDSLRDNQFIPPVYITDFLLFFNEVQPGSKGSPLKVIISETKELTLNHRQSTLTFVYTALNYINPQKNKFKYILEGYEKEWNEVGYRREATYTNLDPGEYVFKVTGSNNDNIWNEEGTSVSITILPAWYHTWIFRIFLIILGLGWITLIYFYRFNIFKRQQILLEETVKERTREVNQKNKLLRMNNELLKQRQQKIEAQTEELMTQKETLELVNQDLKELNSTKDKFFSIIAHDLRNPFNSILGMSEILTKRYDKLSDEKRKKYVDIIYTSSNKVYGLLQNLLDWARSQTHNIKVKPTNFMIDSLVRENIELVSDLAETKGVECKLCNGLNIPEVYADKNMISTIIRNLLTNAIKFSNPGSKVEITITQQLENIRLEIKDEGIGIDKSDIKKLFCVDKNFTRQGTLGETGTGLGLILCKEYIEKNKGKIWVESEEGRGSSFFIQLPL